MSGVARQYNVLADRIMGMRGQKDAHEERMAHLGLTGARMDYEHQREQNRYGLEKAKMAYERFMDEAITGRQAVMGSKLPDETKQRILDTAPSELLDGVYSRRNWKESFMNAVQENKKRRSEGFTLSEGQTRYDASGKVVARAPKKDGKSKKGTLREGVDLFYEVNKEADPKYTRKQALRDYQDFKNYPQAAKMFLETVKLINENEFDEVKKAGLIQKAKRDYLKEKSSDKDTGQHAEVFNALAKQFPDAKDGTVKYLGQQGFIKENGEWRAQ